MGIITWAPLLRSEGLTIVGQMELKALCTETRTQTRDSTMVAQCQSCKVYNLSGVPFRGKQYALVEILLRQRYLNNLIERFFH